MDKSTVVADDTVSSHKHVIGHGVSEHFDPESVSDDFFGLLVEVRMDEGNVVVACDTVSKC